MASSLRRSQGCREHRARGHQGRRRCPRAARSRSCAGTSACSQPRRLSRIPWGEGRPRREHQNCKNRSSWRQECILSTPASSCGHARQSLFLHTVGRGPQLARQNQERLGDTQLSPGSVRDRSHQEAPCCRMSLRQCREKNICSDSRLPATPILHQFPPLFLLLKGLHTLDRTAALGFCSEKQQRCIPRSGWYRPSSSALCPATHRALGGCKDGATLAHQRSRSCRNRRTLCHRG